MRKRKRKYVNAIMLLLILFVLFYIVVENRNTKVTAEELVSSYSIDRQSADNNYLNKDVELPGYFKRLLQLATGKNFVQMETQNDTINLYCVIEDLILLEKALSVTSGTKITIIGKCLGIKEDIFNSLNKSIYINTKDIK